MYNTILEELAPSGTQLVAVSKTKPASAIQDLYDQGQRHFGENRVQECVDKYNELPKDINWHIIGNLQKNKVKYIAPFVHLIHSVDSYNLLATIDKEAKKNKRTIPVLLQFKIASEDTKAGMTMETAHTLLDSKENDGLDHISIHGVMGMASFTSDMLYKLTCSKQKTTNPNHSRSLFNSNLIVSRHTHRDMLEVIIL